MSLLRRTALLAIGSAVLSACADTASAQDVARQEMPKEGVILVAMVKAKAGQEDAVKEALLSLVGPTRKEPGCLCYNLHQSKSDKSMFMFYEQWASQQALDAHGKTPHIMALGAKLKDKTDTGGGVTFYDQLK